MPTAKGDAAKTAEAMGKLRALVGKHRRDVDALGEGLEEGITEEGKRIIAALEKAEAEGGDVHARPLEILAGATVKDEREELVRQDRIKGVIAGPGGVTTTDDESLKDFKLSEMELAIIAEFPVFRHIVGAMAAGKLTAEAAQSLIDGEYGEGVGKLLLAAAAIGVGGTAARLMVKKAARLRRAKRKAEVGGGSGGGGGDGPRGEPTSPLIPKGQHNSAKVVHEAKKRLEVIVRLPNWGRMNRRTSLSGSQASLKRMGTSVGKGGHLPYLKNTTVYEGQLTKRTQFVRVIPKTGDTPGAFLMSLKDFKALRRKGDNAGKAFKDFFALKDEPAFFSIVTVPAGTKMRVGIVGDHPKHGRGGAIQYELLMFVDPKLWSKAMRIKGN